MKTASPGVICAVVTPHTPRMADAATAPEFVHGLIAGSRALGEALRALRPDLFVVNSAHWVSSFNWYATCHGVHEGVCVADEAPDMIPGIPYRRTGDEAFAREFVARLGAQNIPCHANESRHFHWDYGALVPLLYIDPAASVPVVQIPTVLSADLDEALRVGRLVHETACATGRRVIHIASCALSHAILRGPSKWPTPPRRELDARFIELACRGAVHELIEWLPQFNREAVAEMGGRPLATFLGALAAHTGAAFEGRQFGPYGQSSGSGNASIAVTPAA